MIEFDEHSFGQRKGGSKHANTPKQPLPKLHTCATLGCHLGVVCAHQMTQEGMRIGFEKLLTCFVLCDLLCKSTGVFRLVV